MIPRYIVTLAIAIILVTSAVSTLQFATRSQVLSGNTVDEALHLEFTVDAENNQTYVITPKIVQFLQDHVSLRTEGPAHVISTKIEVTPKDVSWTESRRTITSTGAGMSVQFQWNTPSDTANGAHGVIYLDFPEIPGLEGKTPTFHSGGYQVDDAGRYVVREVTTYQSPFQLSLARFRFGLSAGLPFGILLHTICWAFVVKSERRSRIAAFPPQGPGLPATFYPHAVAEWSIWLVVFGMGSLMATAMAGFSVSDGFISSSFTSTIYIIVAVGAALALVCAYFTGKHLLSVRVESDGISYARGRGELQWLSVKWSDVLQLTQKSRTYRGNTTYWVEVQFNDGRKKLKIHQSIEGYPALRDLLFAQGAGKQ